MNCPACRAPNLANERACCVCGQDLLAAQEIAAEPDLAQRMATAWANRRRSFGSRPSRGGVFLIGAMITLFALERALEAREASRAGDSVEALKSVMLALLYTGIIPSLWISLRGRPVEFSRRVTWAGNLFFGSLLAVLLSCWVFPETVARVIRAPTLVSGPYVLTLDIQESRSDVLPVGVSRHAVELMRSDDRVESGFMALRDLGGFSATLDGANFDGSLARMGLRLQGTCTSLGVAHGTVGRLHSETGQGIEGSFELERFDDAALASR